jgi:hypothetical protein
MTQSPLETRLTEWLHRAAPKGSASVLAAALARTHEVGQRSRWRLTWADWTRGLAPAGSRARMVGLVLLSVVALAIAVAGVSFLGSSRPVVLPPIPTPSPLFSPTTAPIGTASSSVEPTASPSSIDLPTAPSSNAWASIHWSMPDPSAFAGPNTFLASVVPFGGGYVGVGKDDQNGTLTAVVWLSGDGKRWERLQGGAAFAGFYMAGVAAGPSGLVATGGSTTAGAAAWRSTDGRVWVREASSTAPFRGPTAFGPTGVIGTVGFGQLALSTAPGKWEELAGATDLADLADVWGDSSTFTAIGSVRGVDQLCHAGASWSVDGRVWAPASIADPGAGFANATSALGDLVVQGVTGSCASGLTPTGLWLSPDGKSYQAVSVPLPQDWCGGSYSTRCLAGDTSRIVVVGPHGEVVFSEDGATWWRSLSTVPGTTTFDPEAQGYIALAVGEPGIVVAVTNGVNVQQLWLGEPRVR